MSDYIVTQSVTDCIGCRACEAHCRLEHGKDEEAGLSYCQIIEVERKRGSMTQVNYVYLHCFHCTKPACVEVCPTGAMRRRVKDGIVYVEEKLCVGCKSCITACSWAVPRWNTETGKVEKCDLCRARIDQGLEPACVTKCTTNCLTFSTTKKAFEKTRRAFAEKIVKHRD
ncbi:MAG: 4Fe-4S dicluster domain-containing protein [Desulfobulbus sp.]|jgi:Fe-S-cluster-containing dehydrogenase component